MRAPHLSAGCRLLGPDGPSRRGSTLNMPAPDGPRKQVFHERPFGYWFNHFEIWPPGRVLVDGTQREKPPEARTPEGGNLRGSDSWLASAVIPLRTGSLSCRLCDAPLALPVSLSIYPRRDRPSRAFPCFCVPVRGRAAARWIYTYRLTEREKQPARLLIPDSEKLDLHLPHLQPNHR